tara:strand:+ start:387 stop:548 length:162 start_codon:yes stop_codon:yes gene_type:complete
MFHMLVVEVVVNLLVPLMVEQVVELIKDNLGQLTLVEVVVVTMEQEEMQVDQE